ncbi:MAG: hypothetical protein KAS32_00075 [Candidatus Peribacteraceae bacterium]|nr:hypothetical protein [Candidatus Peribacteraceae bacterium]
MVIRTKGILPAFDISTNDFNGFLDETVGENGERDLFGVKTNANGKIDKSLLESAGIIDGVAGPDIVAGDTLGTNFHGNFAPSKIDKLNVPSQSYNASFISIRKFDTDRAFYVTQDTSAVALKHGLYDFDESDNTLAIDDKGATTTAYFSAGNRNAICRSYATNKVVVFQTIAGVATTIRCTHYTIAGSVVTEDNTADIVLTGVTSIIQLDAVQIGTSKFAITARTAGAITPQILVALTITADVPTWGTHIVLSTSMKQSKLLKIADDKFVAVNNWVQDNTDTRVQAFSVSGTTITSGAELILNATPDFVADLILVDTDKFLVVDKGNDAYLITLSVLVATLQDTENSGENGEFIKTIGVTDFWLLSDSGAVRKITVTGNSLNTTLETIGLIVGPEAKTDSFDNLINMGDFLYFTGQTGFTTGTVTKWTSRHAGDGTVGFAQNNALSGLSVSVLNNGLDENQVGLVPGTTYVVLAPDGILTPTNTIVNADDRPIYAVSETSAII